ncbi:hypothetical protein A2U01_0089511, partial [Trifolium medium]|nr:hypothetical protein [Trifolium medium]
DFGRISSMGELTETHGTILLNIPRLVRYRRCQTTLLKIRRSSTTVCFFLDRYGKRMATMLAQWNHQDVEGAGR